ncbi:MAG: tRNA lysidine(34) synthetase TilS [Desulfonatronovibrio sp.]
MYFRLQDLPPRWARFCVNIHSFMEEMIQESLEGKNILLSLSGGPDSIGLLRVLDFLRPRAGFFLSAVHLNHMLREESFSEHDFVQEQCSNLKIPLHAGSSNVRSYSRWKKKGIEESARIIRYRFVRDVAEKEGSDFILTAHHLNDLAEDVLMRLGRGTGWPGLCGMKGFDPERKLLRPLIITPKKNILDFLHLLNQYYVTDKSNEDLFFTRNKVGLKIVPLMEEINPGFLESIASLWRLGRSDEQFWEDALKGIYFKQEGAESFFAYENLCSLSKSGRLRLYKKILDKLGPGQSLASNLWDLDKCWESGTGGKMIMFPGNKFAKIEKRGIRFGLLS